MAVAGYVKHAVWLHNLFIIRGQYRYRWPSFHLVHSSMTVAQCPERSGSPEAALAEGLIVLNLSHHNSARQSFPMNRQIVLHVCFFTARIWTDVEVVSGVSHNLFCLIISPLSETLCHATTQYTQHSTTPLSHVTQIISNVDMQHQKQCCYVSLHCPGCLCV